MGNMRDVKEYVSHYSAAKMWNISYVDYFLKKEYVAGCSCSRLNDITVTDRSALYHRKNHNVHLCTYPLPRGAVVKLGEKSVSSPELLFLEMANELSIQELILFGLQLCSHSPGKPSTAITTKRRLNEFLKKTPGFFGHVKAKRAVRYIENGSNSIMESLVFMILAMPYKLGGFGLDDVRFNYEIVLDSTAKSQLGQSRVFVDLYYPKANMAIEYDSTSHHDDEKTYEKDMLRSNIIKNMGIDVIHLTRNQLYNKKICESIAHNIASKIGRRLLNKKKSFYQSNIALRKLLPSE